MNLTQIKFAYHFSHISYHTIKEINSLEKLATSWNNYTDYLKFLNNSFMQQLYFYKD